MSAWHRRSSKAALNRGQALVEWIVFAAGILVIWSASITLATRMLNRTASQSWSVIASRQALSGARTLTPAGLLLNKEARRLRARASVRAGGAVEVYELNAEASSSNSRSSGFLSLLSLE